MSTSLGGTEEIEGEGISDLLEDCPRLWVDADAAASRAGAMPETVDELSPLRLRL